MIGSKPRTCVDRNVLGPIRPRRWSVQSEPIAEFPDAQNGIENLFAKNLYAENITATRGTFDELCVKDDVGVPVCVTGIQLRSLLSGSVLGASAANDNDPSASTDAEDCL